MIQRLSLSKGADAISGAASGAQFAYRSWRSIGLPASKVDRFSKLVRRRRNSRDTDHPPSISSRIPKAAACRVEEDLVAHLQR
ncbi:MAG: hypothetical protein ACRDOP_18130, partial [Gaiellaceae bacterium]